MRLEGRRRDASYSGKTDDTRRADRAPFEHRRPRGHVVYESNCRRTNVLTCLRRRPAVASTSHTRRLDIFGELVVFAGLPSLAAKRTPKRRKQPAQPVNHRRSMDVVRGYTLAWRGKRLVRRPRSKRQPQFPVRGARVAHSRRASLATAWDHGVWRQRRGGV